MTHRPASVRSFVPGLLVASTLALTFGLPACQADEPEKKATPSVGTGGTGGTGGGTSGKGGSGAKGGTGGSGGGGGDEAGGNGAGGSSDDPCGGTEATLFQINDAASEGAIKPNQRVKVAGIVVTSHKFLASASSCLWAVTATMPGDDVQEYGSIQVVAKGNPALIGQDDKPGPCPMGEGEAGPIPNDIKPGDVIDVTAFAAEFVQQSCDGTKNPKPAVGQKQLEINTTKIGNECFVRTPGDAVPAAHAFTAAEATAFAEGKNADNINSKWSGALISLTGPLTPKQSDKTADYIPATAAVSKFGDMLLNETTLAINNNVVYSDVTGTGPKDSAKRVCWPLTTTFDNITGLGLIDFCTFSLSLRTVTGDVTPESSCTQ